MATTPPVPTGPARIWTFSRRACSGWSQVILVFVAILLVAGLGIQTSFLPWRSARRDSRRQRPRRGGGRAGNPVDHAAVITYARALGAAFIKTSSLFLGFILIFTGTLYVLRTAEASFSWLLQKEISKDHCTPPRRAWSS